eukprot:gnl/TRDRNA2_/TRDRNA2_135345_c0_seq1.p1 gnl/TRDRNA2_/TRDRNA2_135345_c0~~gnl/TRDRNA2_/TRDRNA2_135345_c0_seq1.p1  ORF type:complete len:670 (-),score=113.94 gnl/TRDRNA2_/TRDRNA2_135345_c0_seq1:87-1898(-)
MPSHGEILRLLQWSLALTERWHGRPNISALYEFFMDMAECDGHSPYMFRDLPQERSSDRYVRVLDGQARRKLYSGPGAKAADKPTYWVGRMPQPAGETAIDNLVLPNVMKKQKTLLLLAGHRIQQLVVRCIQKKQRSILARLELVEFVAEGVDLETHRSEIRQKVQGIIESQGIEESTAHTALAESGQVLESYGQLPEKAREQIESFLDTELGRAAASTAEPDEELAAFVEHCEKHPGRAFKGSSVQQKLMIFKAIKSPAVKILWRSQTERFTQHKYFAVPWRRSVPLLALQPKADTEESSGLTTLRQPGAVEFSRYRKNIFAYGESHGISLSAGGCAEETEWQRGTLMYEFGVLLCVDEAAKVPNHGVTDIEKIVKDCMSVCPEGGMADALPGEVLHDVGQNPVIASSIGPTQHTQIMRAAAADFPLMAEQCQPKWHERLGASVDVVQVGESEDAFFVSARSKKPEAEPFLQFLVDLRTHLVKAFGSTVDFNATCHPTSEGEFIFNLAPVACMKKITVPDGEGCLKSTVDFQNPDTEERVTSKPLPCATVDCSHGKGNVIGLSDEYWKWALEGRPMLAMLYDFNRKPGSRAVVDSFLQGLAT